MPEPWQLKELSKNLHPAIRAHVRELRRIGPFVGKTQGEAAKAIGMGGPQFSKVLSGDRPSIWEHFDARLHRAAVDAAGREAVISEDALRQLCQAAVNAWKDPGCPVCVPEGPPLRCGTCGSEFPVPVDGSAPDPLVGKTSLPVPPQGGDRQRSKNKLNAITNEFVSLAAERRTHGGLEGALEALIGGADSMTPADTAAAVNHLHIEQQPDLAQALEVMYGRDQSLLRAISFAYELLDSYARADDAKTALQAALHRGLPQGDGEPASYGRP